MELREGIEQAAAALGIDPIDLATAISYETAGTFDPTKAGPTTQWGQHRGLIQFGEPQAQQFGVDWNNPIGSQLGSDGAVVRYLRDAGVQPGMGLLDVYSAINAGSVGRYNASDANNGGAPGTVRDKVNSQMEGHRAKAVALFGGTYVPPPPGAHGSTDTMAVNGAVAQARANGLHPGLTVPNAAPTADFTSNREMNAAAQGTQIGALEGMREAIKSEWAGSFALAQLGREDFAPDDNFQYSEELWNELTDGLPEAYHAELEDAMSLPHARAIAARSREMAETDAKLASLGGWGATMRIGAAVFDPVAIGVAVATDGVAAPLLAVQKATRLNRALRVGGSAAASNAAVEGYLASQDPTRGATDVLLAGATGLAVGGALGAFVPTRMDRDLEMVARSMQRDMQPVVRTEGNSQSLGAARVEGLDEPVLSAAERSLLAAQDAPFSAMGNARIDMVGQNKQSAHPLVRALTGAIAEDGVGNADGSVLARSASENVAQAMRVRMSSFYRTAEPAFRTWAKEAGIPLWKRAAYREDFFNEVGMAVRRPDGMLTDNVQVNKVANEMRRAQKDLLQFAREKGLRGFDQVSENSEYLMRVFHHKRLDDMFERFGESPVKRMVAQAILRGSDNVDYEDAHKIAGAYLKSIRSQKYQDVQLSRVFSEDQADLLEQILLDAGEMTSEQVASIVSTVRKPVSTDGKMGRAQRRLRLDETYRTDFIDANQVRHPMGIEDFLDNNAERLMTLYTRQITGAGFMQDALSQFNIPRLDGEVDAVAPQFDTIIRHIRETAGEFNMKPAQLDREIEKLETLYKATMGIPLTKNTRMSEALRMLRDYNFIRVMNQVGFAQIGEIGNIIGAGGWRATMQHVPELRNIYKRAQNGRLEDEFLDEIETIWGIGTDRLRNTATNRMDDYGIYDGAGVGKVDDLLQRGKQITADISFMAPVNMALQRMAGRVAIQRWMNDAVNGTSISPSRLASMGVTEEMAGRIRGQMLDHVKVAEGLLGRNVKRLNIEDWADQDAAQAFINAIDRWSKKIIQENDIGQMSQWMTTPLGRTVIQFRSFMVAAWTKQTLTGLHHRDWETFSMWSTGIFFGGLSYMAQTQINSLGRDDRDEFLRERMSPEAIGRSAFQRAGFSTIIPGATDSALWAVGYEPVFAYGRSTGLSSGAFLGNPTSDLADKALKAARGGAASLSRSDYDFSQQDYRAITSIAPFQNAMVIRNGLQLLGQNLPKWSE